MSISPAKSALLRRFEPVPKCRLLQGDFSMAELVLALSLEEQGLLELVSSNEATFQITEAG